MPLCFYIFISGLQLWDLSSRSLLTTFQFPRPISSLAWDLTERIFFAASADGHIHQMNLFRQRETKPGGQFIEAVGGAGINDVIRVSEEDCVSQKKRLIFVSWVFFSTRRHLFLNSTTDNLSRPFQYLSHRPFFSLALERD